MLMSASPEFISLCQSQVVLTGEALGATSTAVYLAENWGVQALPELVPVATYPTHGESVSVAGERGESRDATTAQRLLSSDTFEAFDTPLPPPASSSPQVTSPPTTSAPRSESEGYLGLGIDANPEGADDRVVIPLVHESVVMGVLVSWRYDRPWQGVERHQLEGIAQTLALACVLDQRGQWIQARLQEHRRDQSHQSERFHELLHQVRNPLTALRTFGKLLTKRLTPEDRNHALATGIVRESDRMESLLTYFDSTLRQGDTQLAAGKVPLSLPAAPDTPAAETTQLSGAEVGFGGPLTCEIGSLSDWLPEMLASAPTLASENHIQFHTQVPPHLPAVLADPIALREVVVSLLENAFKYAPAQAQVWVQAGITPTGSVLGSAAYQGLLVGDTGPGIPKADQPYIFQRRYRGIQAQGPIAGTGLGLAIVQDLVQRMQGHVEVYSPLRTWPGATNPDVPAEACDRGTIFAVWLPLARAVNH
jgi:signal transduction histidine kinase